MPHILLNKIGLFFGPVTISSLVSVLRSRGVRAMDHYNTHLIQFSSVLGANPGSSKTLCSSNYIIHLIYRGRPFSWKKISKKKVGVHGFEHGTVWAHFEVQRPRPLSHEELTPSLYLTFSCFFHFLFMNKVGKCSKTLVKLLRFYVW